MGKILLEEQTAPSTPSSNVVAVYVDVADGHLKIKKDNGEVIDLEEINTASLVLPSGEVAFGTGSNTISSADLKWDDVSKTLYINGKIGAGTDTPQAPIDASSAANGATGVSAIIRNRGTVNSAWRAAIYFGDVNTTPSSNRYGRIESVYESSGNIGIRFSTYSSNSSNVDCVVIKANGNLGIGTTSPNQKLHVAGNANVQGDVIQAPSGKVYLGDGATNTHGWRDMLGHINIASGGSNNPTWSQFRNGIYLPRFSATAMNEVWINFHINHDYAPGTVIYPHVHWMTNTTSTGTVRWGIEYTVAKGHDQEAFAATTTVYVEQTISSNKQYQHLIAEVSQGNAIPSTSCEVDSVIMCRIFRDAAHANDTYPDAVFVNFVDCHYQVATLFTKNKAPNFYT